MCWNAEVSLHTFLVSFISTIVLYYIGYDKLILSFIMSFIIMQLVEFFMWIYIKQPDILRIFGIISFILIFIQPIIVLYYANYAYIIKYYLVLQLLLLIICILFFQLRLSSFKFLPYVAKNGHLSWNWIYNNEVYIHGFFTIYLVFFLGTLFIKQYYVLFAICVLTLLFSMYNYSKYKTVSSMWCWIANFIVILILIDAIIKYITNN